MIFSSMRAAALVSLVVGVATASAQTIYSNNPSGDNFNNPGTIGATLAVGATGWYYTNVRNDGTVGINTNYARSGNGSVFLKGTQGPGGNSSKADIEYYQFQTPGAPTSGLAPMGTLGLLNSLSYDWYRNSSSTNDPIQNPVLRVYIDADGNLGTTSDQGFLVFERAYNTGNAPVPTDQWIHDDIYNWFGAGSSANMWLVNFGNSNGSIEQVYNRTIQNWINTPNPDSNYPTLSASSVIYGLSAGFGSGWGSFEGAVDNISIGFGGGAVRTFNFEAQPVPEPATMAALGFGALALLRRRRKV